MSTTTSQNFSLYFYLTLLLVGFWLFPNVAWGFFSNIETASQQSFAAGVLELEPIIVSPASLTIEPSGSATTSVSVKAVAGSIPAVYDITVTATSGNATWCDSLDLTTTNPSNTDRNSAATEYSSGSANTFGAWDFTFSTDSNSTLLQGAECTITYTADTWSEQMSKGNGFVDSEDFSITLVFGSTEAKRKPASTSTDAVVMNEFLPNPDGILCTDGTSNCAPGDPEFIFDFGNDRSDMPQGEWIELYNNSDFPADVSGWYFEDVVSNTVAITAANTQPATTTVPAKGWLVVYMNKAFLNNTGDTFTLHDASGTPIDTYTYSGSDTCDKEPTPGDLNDPSIGSPGCSGDVPPNKSYARIPDGIGDFVDPIPSPGGFNTVSADELRAAGWSEAEIAALGDGRVTDATSTARTTTADDSKTTDEDTPRFSFATGGADTGSSSDQLQTNKASTTASSTDNDTSTTTATSASSSTAVGSSSDESTTKADHSSSTHSSDDPDTGSTTTDQTPTSTQMESGEDGTDPAPATGNSTESALPAKTEEEDTDTATDTASDQVDDTESRKEEDRSDDQDGESTETVSAGGDAGATGSANDPEEEAAARPEDAPAPDEMEQVTETTSV